MSHAPTDALKRRHAAIREALEQHSLDALVVTALPNIKYLTNFSGSAAIVVMTAKRLVFITDFRYIASTAETRGTPHECPDLELVTVEHSYDATLAQVLRANPGPRVGFEAAHLSVSRHTWLQTAVSTGPKAPQLVAVEGLVERARVQKDAYELTTLREAARRLSRVVPAIVQEVRPERTERGVAVAIDRLILDAGFEKTAFDTIVAGGPNAALPHATPTKRKLAEGDIVVLDFGGVYDSYCVDLTRTVVIGTATPRAREVHRAVLAAHDCAIEAVRPGVSRFAIDAAARDSLAGVGMAEAFGHSTGHGLGLEVHEDPKIARRRSDDTDTPDAIVASDMVFTIEPGAYFPGWGGVRIEDDILVTREGAEVLTVATTELIEV